MPDSMTSEVLDWDVDTGPSGHNVRYKGKTYIRYWADWPGALKAAQKLADLYNAKGVQVESG